MRGAMSAKDEDGEPLLGVVGSWHTLRAVGREWRHQAHLTEAFERGTTPPPGTRVASFRSSFVSQLPEPSDREEPWSVCIEKPDLKRAEFMVGGERVAVVVHGDYWWNWSPSRGARTNGGRTNYRRGTIRRPPAHAAFAPRVAVGRGLARHPAGSRRHPPSRLTSGGHDRTRLPPDDGILAPRRVGRGRVPVHPRRRTGCATPVRSTRRGHTVSGAGNDRDRVRGHGRRRYVRHLTEPLNATLRGGRRISGRQSMRQPSPEPSFDRHSPKRAEPSPPTSSSVPLRQGRTTLLGLAAGYSGDYWRTPGDSASTLKQLVLMPGSQIRDAWRRSAAELVGSCRCADS